MNHTSPSRQDAQKSQSQAERRKTILQQLAGQYKTYREECRSYVGYAAASTTLLVFLLLSEINAARAKDNPNPKLYFLVVVSFVWYGALMAIFISHVIVMSEYLELLERKINDLLQSDVFEFENKYTFPSSRPEEIGAYVVFCLFGGVLMLGLTLYSGYFGLRQGYGWSPYGAGLILHGCVIALVLLCCIVLSVKFSRREQNKELLKQWETHAAKLRWSDERSVNLVFEE